MSIYLQKLRIGFFKLSLREQILILAILSVLILWWISAELTDWRSYWTRYNSQNFQLQEQQIWLDDQDRIEQGLVDTLERLDSNKTFSETELAGRIDDIARAIFSSSGDATYQTSQRDGESTEDFEIHRRRISIRSAELRPLIEFCSKLQAESPYIVIDNLDLSANRSRPTLHNANFIISSFELKNIAP